MKTIQTEVFVDGSERIQSQNLSSYYVKKNVLLFSGSGVYFFGRLR